MALADEVFGFYIPTVSLMGVGCAKETGAQAKALGATNMLIVTDAGMNKLADADSERLRKTSIELLARHCQLMLESMAPPAVN